MSDFSWPSDSACAENDELNRVCEKLEEVMDERDEADRRAGAAERHSAGLEKDTRSRREWLRIAKEEAGYGTSVSFDVVWAETLAKAQAHDKLDREIAQHDTDRSAERVARMKAERKRDALAAHVERLDIHAKSCAIELAAMIDRYNTQSMEDGSWEYDHQTPHGLMVALRDSPKTSLDRLKAQCWKEAYLAGMDHGHHWTVEGGFVPADEEAAEDYVADRQAEEGE